MVDRPADRKTIQGKRRSSSPLIAEEHKHSTVLAACNMFYEIESENQLLNAVIQWSNCINGYKREDQECFVSDSLTWEHKYTIKTTTNQALLIARVKQHHHRQQKNITILLSKVTNFTQWLKEGTDWGLGGVMPVHINVNASIYLIK